MFEKNVGYKKYYTEIDNKKSLHLFDVPHLLNGLRNTICGKEISAEFVGRRASQKHA